MIIRQNYLDQLIAYRDKPVIKIITGMRRCGKSTIMALYKDYLLGEGAADIYLTGSNSNLLSSEIATLLSGRYVTIKILPLSFQEYLLFVLERKQKEERQYNSLRRSLRKDMDQGNNIALDIKRYIRFGGLPTIPFLPQERSMVITYLEGVYNSVVVKDILTNNGITNIQALKKIIRYVAGSTGKVLNPKLVSDYFLTKYPDENFSYPIVARFTVFWDKKIQDLKSIPDCYQKYVISMNRVFPKNIPGIKFINLPDFLLKQDYEFVNE